MRFFFARLAAGALMLASSFAHAQTVDTRIGKLNLDVGYPTAR